MVPKLDRKQEETTRSLEKIEKGKWPVPFLFIQPLTCSVLRVEAASCRVWRQARGAQDDGQACA